VTEVKPFALDSEPPVRGYLHSPEAPSGGALILAHGAGSNANAPLLVAVARAFADAGFIVLRCDLPYRQKRSYGPPLGPAAAAEDRAGLRNAVEAVRNLAARPKRVFLGGHSYGGRQASILATETPGLVDGLLLLSYPLHPPKKPTQLRTRHFSALSAPALFVSGSRDPFGSLAEMESALKLIPARVSLYPIEGAGHDLGFSRKSDLRCAALPQEIVARFRQVFES
jgi:uncharacterized protein